MADHHIPGLGGGKATGDGLGRKRGALVGIQRKPGDPKAKAGDLCQGISGIERGRTAIPGRARRAGRLDRLGAAIHLGSQRRGRAGGADAIGPLVAEHRGDMPRAMILQVELRRPGAKQGQRFRIFPQPAGSDEQRRRNPSCQQQIQDAPVSAAHAGIEGEHDPRRGDGHARLQQAEGGRAGRCCGNRKEGAAGHGGAGDAHRAAAIIAAPWRKWARLSCRGYPKG